MIFLYNQNAGQDKILIEKDQFQHLIKAQRKEVFDKVEVRNLKDKKAYIYEIKEVNKKNALLIKINEKEIKEKRKIDLNIFWCITEPKTIKDSLPFLNQLNLKKIFLVYCDRSQKNFKIDLEKLNKILILSSEQSGRNDILEIEILKKIDWEKIDMKDSFILDFNGKDFSKFEKKKVKNIFIGPEGGFSKEEKERFKKENIISFENTNVLKSEIAVISFLSKFI